MNIEVSKYRKKYKDKLIHKSNIDEELFLIPDSDTDYITKSGKVYKDYGNDMYYPKKPILNKTCGYIYVNITHKGNVNKSTRLHVLLAKMFIHNTNPDVLKFVGHKDNDKTNYALNNLYWTTNQDNTIKAVYDGLIPNKIAEENENSKYVKVIDYKTNEVVGVYGSLREAARCISNISLTTISKFVSSEKDYKPRTKKYIYKKCTEEELNQYSHLKGAHLIESKVQNKNPKIFIMKNVITGYKTVLDNQKTAEKITGISQAIISHRLLDHNMNPDNGWVFILIDETTYKNSSAYKNQLSKLNSYILKNINSGEILEFPTLQSIKEYFNVYGHDLKQYIEKDHIFMSEWRIIPYKKTNIEEMAA